MFPPLKQFDLRQWIDANRDGFGRRRLLWENSDFIAFVTRGPNRRKDFHINPGDEIFYQLEGELSLHYMTPENAHEVATLQPGEMFLLPGGRPHSPRRGEGSWTLVIERRRGPAEQDQFVWFCEGCNQPLYRTTVRFDDPSDAVAEAYAAIRADEKLRTCSRCGAKLDID